MTECREPAATVDEHPREHMLLHEAREQVACYCQRLVAERLVVGTAGNISLRVDDLIAVTPSGLHYSQMSAGLVGVHQLDGSPVDAPLSPTSELPMHLAVYRQPAQPSAVVHTHSLAATTVSTLVWEVPAIHYYLAMFGGPVRVAPYATYGSDELARNMAEAMQERTACLLSNHGAVTIGTTLREAYERALYLEWLCEIYLKAAQIGNPRLLDEAEIRKVHRKLSGYGQRPPEN